MEMTQNTKEHKITYLDKFLTRPVRAHGHHPDSDFPLPLGDLDVMRLSDRHRAVACYQRLRLRILLWEFVVINSRNIGMKSIYHFHQIEM